MTVTKQHTHFSPAVRVTPIATPHKMTYLYPPFRNGPFSFRQDLQNDPGIIPSAGILRLLKYILLFEGTRLIKNLIVCDRNVPNSLLEHLQEKGQGWQSHPSQSSS